MHNNHAHHRRDYRAGPWEGFLQRKARAIQKLVAPGRVLERLVAEARPVGINLYHIPAGAALLLRARATLDEFRAIANDADGEVLR
jgi:hypothetical protein